jgi:Rrf2 family protein
MNPKSAVATAYHGVVKVSTRGDYASRALLSLALHDGERKPTSVRDIAERTGLPQPYLEQILLALKGAGLVRSKRGVGGGYVLARSPAAITLGQIVSSVEGPIVAGDFGEPHQNGACDHEGQCVLLAVWADVGEHMRVHLDSFTLADMVTQAQANSVPMSPMVLHVPVGTAVAAPQATSPQAAATPPVATSAPQVTSVSAGGRRENA